MSVSQYTLWSIKADKMFCQHWIAAVFNGFKDRIDYLNYYIVSSFNISGVVSIYSMVWDEIKTFLSIQKKPQTSEMKFGDSEKNLYSETTLVKNLFFVSLFLMKLQFLNKNCGNFKISYEKKIPNFGQRWLGIMTDRDLNVSSHFNTVGKRANMDM